MASQSIDSSGCQLENLLHEWCIVNDATNSFNLTFEIDDEDLEDGDSNKIDKNNNPNANNEQIAVKQNKQNTDFEAIFLKTIGNTEEIEMIQNKREKIFSQTADDLNVSDIESVIKTYLLNNRKKSTTNDNPTTIPFDFEAFLVNKQNIVNIECEGKSKLSNGTKAKNTRFTIGPLPLLIEDILQIKLNEQFNAQRSMFGQNFRSVIFHGFCVPQSCSSQGEKNRKKYLVDDGSGCVKVVFNHGAKNNGLATALDNLYYEYSLARREGIPCLGESNYKPQTAKCKEILEKIQILLNVIKRNSFVPMEHFKTGRKVFVIGTPFRNAYDKLLSIWAFDIYEDTGKNRDMEIMFKRNLINQYNTKYLKYTIDGKLIA